MSEYQQKDNSGSLFKNNRREKDTHPNATGKAMVGGVLYYVSAWTKKDKNGNPWQSLSFKVVTDEATRAAAYEEPLNDDVPF